MSPPARRLRCGAHARTTGKPCRRWALAPDRTRCRLHGGRSTGPTTRKGLERAQLARVTSGAKVKPATVEALLAARGRGAGVSLPTSDLAATIAGGELSATDLERELQFARHRLATTAELEVILGVSLLGAELAYLDQIRLLALAIHGMGRGGGVSGAFEVQISVVGADGSRTTVEPGGRVTRQAPPGATNAGLEGRGGGRAPRNAQAAAGEAQEAAEGGGAGWSSRSLKRSSAGASRSGSARSSRAPRPPRSPPRRGRARCAAAPRARTIPAPARSAARRSPACAGAGGPSTGGTGSGSRSSAPSGSSRASATRRSLSGGNYARSCRVPFDGS